ncbi:RNA polymerase sigma factor [Spirillospora sp. CA-128828]|uniref:RNA polymerase sigma factor n=1 Tax=Spirillospora sp. CA-128828 TaxID=3240033 RepID=UPI003D901B2F
MSDLFRAEASDLFAFACARLTQGNRTEAEDLIQQVFEAAARHWESTLEGRTPEGRRRWLYRVLKYKCIDTWRKERRIIPIEDCPDDEAAPGDLGEGVLCAAALQQCWQVIAKMPADRARVAFLCWGESWSSEEVAAWLGITQSTVRGHLKKARDELVVRVGPSVPFIEDSEQACGRKGTSS